MPEFQDSELGSANILKPAKLGLKVADKVQHTFSGPHAFGGKDNLPSVPVSMILPNGKDEKGSYPLYQTHKRMLADKLGKNSDSWKGSKFSAAVIPQNNPQTKGQVLSWAIDPDSITKGK